MPYSKDYLEYVLEQLAGLRGAVSRRMFGGAGLYYEELFFGLIAGDTLYLRVNDANRADYETLGMRRFRPYADKPHLSFNYYEVPAHVLEDADELVSWARRSLQAAQTAAAARAAGQELKRVRRTKSAPKAKRSRPTRRRR
jgi:DNA transformation protein